MRKVAVVFAIAGGLLIWVCSVAIAAWSGQGAGVAAGQAATLNAGNPPSAEASGSTVRLAWPASTMSGGAPVAGYVLKRYDLTGTVRQDIVSGTCSSTVAGTGCTEIAVPDGTWRYSVTPAQDNWRGAESPTASVTVDTVAPSVSVTFPVSGAQYNAAGYTDGCDTTATGDICGTAGSHAGHVQVSIRRDSTGDYWNGTGFASGTETLFDTTGASSWSYGLDAADLPGDGSYTVRVHATDDAGNVGTADSTFTLDRTAPSAPAITGNPPNPSSSSAATLSFDGPAPGVAYECRLDGAAYTTCSSPQDYNGLADGSHTFVVRAVDAAGNRSAAASYTWTIDTIAPSAFLDFPVPGALYNATSWTQGCGTATTGDICGTSADSDTGVASVRISIRTDAGDYWDGAAFDSATPVLLAPSGTTDWSYAFAAASFTADGAYTVRVTTTDGAGNQTVSASTFTVDLTAPAARDVQTTNAGSERRPQPGDTITFTYTETMAPGSILPGWTGNATDVVVRVNDGILGHDTLTVWNPTNTTATNLGTANLGRSDYVLGNVIFGATGTPSTMVQNGSGVTVTLGTASSTLLVSTALGSAQMVWSPSAAATDLAGNPASTAPASESGAPDGDF